MNGSKEPPCASVNDDLRRCSESSAQGCICEGRGSKWSLMRQSSVPAARAKPTVRLDGFSLCLAVARDRSDSALGGRSLSMSIKMADELGEKRNLTLRVVCFNLYLYPIAAGFVRSDRSMDEPNSFFAVFDPGDAQPVLRWHHASTTCSNGHGKLGVKIGPSLHQAFGKSPRGADETFGLW